MRVSEICVKRIRVNQGLGVHMHKNKNAPPETISPQCDLYGQQRQFAYFIIVTALY